MVQPVTGAIDAFLAIFNSLPQPIIAFIYLALALFFIMALIKLVLKVGG